MAIATTFPPSAIVEAQWVAERRGRERFVCEQPPYSMLLRGIEREVLPTIQRYHMGAIVWSPLAGGWLSGRYRRDRDVPTSSRARRVPQRFDLSLPENQRKLDAVEELTRLAEKAGRSLIEMALAFVLEHPGVTSAIIGPRTSDQLDDQLRAVDVVLESDVLDAVDAIVAPGVTLNDADAGYQPPSLTSPSHRRRYRR